MDVTQLPLVGEHPVLDFINTVDDPETASEVDYLPNYERFIDVCARVNLVQPGCHDPLIHLMVRHPVISRRVFREAITLRDHLRNLLLAIAQSEDLRESGIDFLNQLAAEAFAHRRLEAQNGPPLSWQWTPDSSSLRIPLWAIALQASELLCDDERLHRLKVCANDPCKWLFLDYSRNGRRRWCSMSECGNQAKVRRLRARRRTKR